MANLAQLCKEKIQKGPGYANFIARFVTVDYINDTGEARFCCVAHEEETSSCHLNTTTGLWKCHSANCNKSGDIIDFFGYVKGLTKKGEIIRQLALDLGIIGELTDELVEELVHALWSRPQVLQKAAQMFGVEPETLRRFKVGFRFDPEKKEARFTIPIRGESGLWEDIRLYNRGYTPKIKSWAPGHGGCRVFGLDPHAQETLFLFEGEKDAIRATEFGIKGAISFTGGAGNTPEDLGSYFKGKTCYVCYDVDKAGLEGAEKVASRLACYCQAVFIVNLPREGMPETGDFSDWVNLGNTHKEWEELVTEARPVAAPQGTFDGAPVTGEPTEVEFRDLVVKSELFGKPVRFLARAIGSSVGLPNYQAPVRVLIDCPKNQKRLCSACGLARWDHETKPWNVTLDYRTEKSLQLIRCNEQQQNHAIRDIFAINHECKAVKIASQERHAIQRLLLSSPCELNQMRSSYQGELDAYYHGEPFTDNRDYWFEGYVQADPKTQGTVLNLISARPARSAIESFEINEDVYEALEFFRPQTGATIKEHLEGLHTLIEEDIGIWGQHAMQQAFLEAIFSVLKFRVGSREIENGWVEILILGDTGLAKSTMALRIMRMINVGEYLNGETVSAAGIIGGIEARDKMYIMKWGAFPRNNGGFVVLDEVDAMQKRHKDVTGQLTAMRSTGIAKISKIVDSETPARVRAVWLTNPADCKPIASFNGGCRAIEGIIENRADIARFTKVYAVANDGIDVATITQDRERLEQPILRKHWNTLAILTWSLQPEQVWFTPGAQAYLRDQARILTEKYHDQIPLLEKGRALDKLAKLAVPIAVLCGSFREREGTQTLFVDSCHAEYAVWHLQQTYDAPAMGYRAFSEVEREREKIKNEKEVFKALEQASTPGTTADTLRFFLNYSIVSRNAFRELIGNPTAADEAWACLLRNNCLILGKRLDTATKTSAFARLIEARLLALAQVAAK